jgi:hypothetical protein
MHWQVVLRASLTVLCVLILASRAPAQLSAGSLHGRVVDPLGNPVSGALVSIGGPSGGQSQTTDGGGRFQFLALPPGSYSVKVEREGVTPAGHPNVVVRVGRATVIELTASPGGHHRLGAAESALLDSRVIATGANLRFEQLNKIPFAPDLASILQSTPGVLLDVIDVGGSATGDRPTIVYRGASREANTWTVDGVTLTDMTLLGSAPRYFDFGLIEEVQTVTGGTDIQQMTSGLGVNVVTKRGTNLFQGQGRAFFSNGGAFKNGILPAANTDFDGAMEFGAEAGGAIVKDRLWYFAGADGFRSDREALAGGELAGRDFSRQSVLGKISMRTAGQAMTASAHTSGLGRDGEGAGITRAPSALWNDDGRTSLFKVEDSAALGSRFFLTGLAAAADTGSTLDPAGGGATHLDAFGIFRDGFQHVDADNTSREGRIDFATYLGTHEIKLGAGYRSVSVRSRYEWPGGIVTAASGTPATMAMLPPDLDVAAAASYTSAYVQDTISRGRLTATLGVRFDGQRGRNKRSEVLANSLSSLVPAVTFPGGEPEWRWTSVVPRLGVTYALGPDQTMLLRASFSRYPDQLGIARVLLSNPVAPVMGRELAGSEAFVFFDANGNRLPDPGEMRTASSFVRVSTADPRFLEAPNLVAADFDPAMTNELQLGVDRLVGRGAASAHLQWRKRTGIADEVPLVQIVEGRRPVAFEDFGPGPAVFGTDLDGTAFLLESFDLNPGLFYTGGASVANGAREQRGVNLTLQYDQRYVRGAYLRAWINVGRSEWNVPTTFFIDRNDLIGAGDNDDAPVADQSASPSRQGVFLNSNWSYELIGMSQAPLGLEVAARFYGRQGFPAPQFVIVDAGDATRTIQVGAFDRRLNRLFVADFRVGRSFAVANFDLDVSADVFNLFNTQTAVQRDTDLSKLLKGAVLESLSPRVLRFGVRVKF